MNNEKTYTLALTSDEVAMILSSLDATTRVLRDSAELPYSMRFEARQKFNDKAGEMQKLKESICASLGVSP